MSLTVTKEEVWAAQIEDKPGGLAKVLGALNNVGANLQCVIARRDSEQRGSNDEPLPRAVAEVFRELVFVLIKSEFFKERIRFRYYTAFINVKQIADESHELARGEFFVKEWKVGHVSEKRFGGFGVLLHIEAADACAARARPD